MGKKRNMVAGLIMVALIGIYGYAFAASRLVGENFATVAAGATSTTAAIDIQYAQGVSYFVSYNGDSALAWCQHSLDNSVWADIGTTTDTLDGGDTAVELLLARGLQLLASPTDADGSSHTPGGGLGGYLRVKFKNVDSASPCSTVKVRVQYYQ